MLNLNAKVIPDGPGSRSGSTVGITGTWESMWEVQPTSFCSGRSFRCATGRVSRGVGLAWSCRFASCALPWIDFCSLRALWTEGDVVMQHQAEQGGVHLEDACIPRA